MTSECPATVLDKQWLVCPQKWGYKYSGVQQGLFTGLCSRSPHNSSLLPDQLLELNALWDPTLTLICTPLCWSVKIVCYNRIPFNKQYSSANSHKRKVQRIVHLHNAFPCFEPLSKPEVVYYLYICFYTLRIYMLSLKKGLTLPSIRFCKSLWNQHHNI